MRMSVASNLLELLVRILPREWMFALCVVSKYKKDKMQDNEDEETSTDEIQREYKRIQKNPAGGKECLSCVLSGRDLCLVCCQVEISASGQLPGVL